MDTDDAVRKTIDNCINDGILEELLRRERAKVARHLYEQFTEEELEIARQYVFDESMKEARERGLEQGLEEGIEQGIKQGIEQGIEQGQENVRKLYGAMKKDNRIDDYLKALEDTSLMKSYLQEYGIK